MDAKLRNLIFEIAQNSTRGFRWFPPKPSSLPRQTGGTQQGAPAAAAAPMGDTIAKRPIEIWRTYLPPRVVYREFPKEGIYRKKNPENSVDPLSTPKSIKMPLKRPHGTSGGSPEASDSF